MAGSLLLLLIGQAGTCSAIGGEDDGSDVLTLVTRSWAITFSPVGGVPVAWRIVDDRYATPDRTTAKPVAIELVDVRPEDRHRPFDLVFPDEEVTRRVNRATYRFEQYTEGASHIISFSADLPEVGLTVVKRYSIPDEGFEAGFTVELTSTSGSTDQDAMTTSSIGLSLGPGLGERPERLAGLGGTLYSYVEAFYGSDDDVHSLSVDDAESTLGIPQDGEVIRWAGLHGRYFMMALISGASATQPSFESGWIITSEMDDRSDGTGSGDFDTSPRVELYARPLPQGDPNRTALSLAVYAGPKDLSTLESSSHRLDGILYNGLWSWLRWLCLQLKVVLDWLYHWIGNWGLSILTLAVVVRLLIFPVAQVALRKNAQMVADQTRLKPLIEEVQERFKGDMVRTHDATMAIYREHGVNPHAVFGGCVPVLIQIPVFVALFNLLGQDIGLRGADFLGIDDLSRPDQLFSFGFAIPLLGGHFNLLPVVMAVSMVMVTSLSAPPGADPSQKRSQTRNMTALAVVFFLLFYPFPSGLLIYWIASNLLQFLQQQLINRSLVSSRAGAVSGD